MNNKITLYLFSYVGATSAFYNKWMTYFSSAFKIVPIELAGRGSRVSEPFYKNFKQAIDDIIIKINPMAKNNSFAFYDHKVINVFKRLFVYGGTAN